MQLPGMLGLLTIALLAALNPGRAHATPFVPDFANGPVVFDFEDGLQGWTLHGSAQRVNAQVLGGEWAILGDGLAGAGAFISLSLDFTEVSKIVLDKFVAGDTDPFVRSVFTLFVGSPSPMGGTVPSPTANPAPLTFDVSNLEGTQEAILLWGLPTFCPPGVSCVPDPPDRFLAFIDNITLIPIPEPSTLLLVLGGLGAGAVFGRRRRSKAALLVVGALLWSPAARAVPITFGFEAVVTQFQDGSGILGEGFGVGSPITGSYALDPDAEDTNTNPWLGAYEDAILWLAITANDQRFVIQASGPSQVKVANDVIEAFVNGPLWQVDEFRADGRESDERSFTLEVSSRLVLDQVLPQLLKSDALPRVPFDMNHVTDASVRVSIVPEFGLVATPTSFFLVPEPITALLVAIGLAGLAWSRSRASS